MAWAAPEHGYIISPSKSQHQEDNFDTSDEAYHGNSEVHESTGKKDDHLLGINEKANISVKLNSKLLKYGKHAVDGLKNHVERDKKKGKDVIDRVLQIGKSIFGKTNKTVEFEQQEKFQSTHSAGQSGEIEYGGEAHFGYSHSGKFSSYGHEGYQNGNEQSNAETIIHQKHVSKLTDHFGHGSSEEVNNYQTGHQLSANFHADKYQEHQSNLQAGYGSQEYSQESGFHHDHVVSDHDSQELFDSHSNGYNGHESKSKTGALHDILPQQSVNFYHKGSQGYSGSGSYGYNENSQATIHHELSSQSGTEYSEGEHSTNNLIGEEHHGNSIDYPVQELEQSEESSNYLDYDKNGDGETGDQDYEFSSESYGQSQTLEEPQWSHPPKHIDPVDATVEVHTELHKFGQSIKHQHHGSVNGQLDLLSHGPTSANEEYGVPYTQQEESSHNQHGSYNQHQSEQSLNLNNNFSVSDTHVNHFDHEANLDVHVNSTSKNSLSKVVDFGKNFVGKVHNAVAGAVSKSKEALKSGITKLKGVVSNRLNKAHDLMINGFHQFEQSARYHVAAAGKHESNSDYKVHGGQALHIDFGSSKKFDTNPYGIVGGEYQAQQTSNSISQFQALEKLSNELHHEQPGKLQHQSTYSEFSNDGSSEHSVIHSSNGNSGHGYRYENQQVKQVEAENTGHSGYLKGGLSGHSTVNVELSKHIHKHDVNSIDHHDESLRSKSESFGHALSKNWFSGIKKGLGKVTEGLHSTVENLKDHVYRRKSNSISDSSYDSEKNRVDLSHRRATKIQYVPNETEDKSFLGHWFP